MSRSLIEPLESRIAPALILVGKSANFSITTETGAAGLSAGDTVTFDPGPDTSLTVHAGLTFGTDAFTSIQAGVNAATANDTVQVGPGTFNESVTVSQKLSIEGAQFQVNATSRTGKPETIVTNANGAFQITADDVTISGFTIQGQTANGIGAGIVTSPANSGYNISRNIITDNIVGLKLNTNGVKASLVADNFFLSNDNSGANGGTAILADAAFANVTIDGNAITGAHPGDGIAVLAGAGAGVKIQHNELSSTGAGNGIRVAAGVGAAADFTITENFIAGWNRGVSLAANGAAQKFFVNGNDLSGSVLRAVSINSPGAVDARFNFFGTTDAGAIQALVAGTGSVNFTPFLSSNTDNEPNTSGFQPAATLKLVNATTATWTDPDGDLVTLKVSKGQLALTDFSMAIIPGALGQQLETLRLGDHAGAFAGASVTVTAVRGPAGGDGLADVDQIDAFGTISVDLGKVKIDGNLNQVLAGDTNALTAGLKGLALESFGASRAALSTIFGDCGPLTVRADVSQGAELVTVGDGNHAAALTSATITGNFSGHLDIDGKAGAIVVGGSIRGGDAGHEGEIEIGGSLAGLTVKGGILGGSAQDSGRVEVVGKVGTILINGSLIGGSAQDSGELQLGVVGSINIKGSIQGGTQTASGFVTVNGALGSLTLGGNLSGGPATGSGAIELHDETKAVTIAGSIFGGSGTGNSSVTTFAPLGTFTLKGDLRGSASSSGAVVFGDKVGKVSILGDVLGSKTVLSFEATADSLFIGGSLIGPGANAVQLSIAGPANPVDQAHAVAVKSISILGRVENALITVGTGGVRNPDASLGTLTVGGAWIGSSLSVGVDAGGDFVFGTDDDTAPLTPTAGFSDNSAIIAQVASLVIRGGVFGTAKTGDHFGIVAQSFGKVTIGRAPIPLTAAADQFAFGTTFDVVLAEV